jgi:hypothetical protein
MGTKEEIQQAIQLEMENIKYCNDRLTELSKSQFISEKFVKLYEQQLKELNAIN